MFKPLGLDRIKSIWMHVARVWVCLVCDLCLYFATQGNAKADARDRYQRTPLHLAVIKARKRAIEVLIEKSRVSSRFLITIYHPWKDTLLRNKYLRPRSDVAYMCGVWSGTTIFVAHNNLISKNLSLPKQCWSKYLKSVKQLIKDYTVCSAIRYFFADVVTY